MTEMIFRWIEQFTSGNPITQNLLCEDDPILSLNDSRLKSMYSSSDVINSRFFEIDRIIGNGFPGFLTMDKRILSARWWAGQYPGNSQQHQAIGKNVMKFVEHCLIPDVMHQHLPLATAEDVSFNRMKQFIAQLTSLEGCPKQIIIPDKVPHASAPTGLKIFVFDASSIQVSAVETLPILEYDRYQLSPDSYHISFSEMKDLTSISQLFRPFENVFGEKFRENHKIFRIEKNHSLKSLEGIEKFGKLAVFSVSLGPYMHYAYDLIQHGMIDILTIHSENGDKINITSRSKLEYSYDPKDPFEFQDILMNVFGEEAEKALNAE
jgi:hypothetical protein